MTVIELGLVRDDDDQPAPERPLRRVDVRRWLAAAVGVFCLLAVTGSAAPKPHGLPTLWSTPFLENTDQYQLVGGVVYLLRTYGGAVLAAHDGRTGAELWKTGDIPDASGIGPVRGGLMLLPADHASVQFELDDQSMTSEDFDRRTVAVEMSTGRRLWGATGSLTAATDDRVILSEHNEVDGGLRTLRAVRLRDGSPIWSRPAGAYQTWVVTDGPPYERVVAVTRAGVVEVLDIADGHVVTSKKVPWKQSQVAQEDTSVTLVGDRLMLTYNSPTRTTVVAFERDTMRELWRLEHDGSGGIFDCGPVLCFNSDKGTAGYDRDTGRQRWHTEGVANGFPIFGDKLLTNTDTVGARFSLIDRATGRQVADLGLVNPIWNGSGIGSPYFIKRSTEMPGYTALSYFQEESGELLMRGKLPPVREWGCQSDADLLSCLTDDQHLLVTDVG